MTITQAVAILEEELDESHVRCHYPYVMTCGTTAIGEPPHVKAGTYVMINSDVFGRIATASKATLAESLKAVAGDLLATRQTRWRDERLKPKSRM